MAFAQPPNGDSRPVSGQLRFDIPAQRLSSALKAFVLATHIEVLSDEPAGAELMSGGASGIYTPQGALQALIAGTGLTAQFTGSRTAILRPASSAPPGRPEDSPLADGPVIDLDAIQIQGAAPIAAPSKGRLNYRLYAYSVSQALGSAVRQDPRTSSGAYTARARVWLNEQGHVVQAVLSQSSGQPPLDAQIVRVLRQASVNPPPPEGMPQPVTIVINTRDDP
jgi:TonB family protein